MARNLWHVEFGTLDADENTPEAYPVDVEATGSLDALVRATFILQDAGFSADDLTGSYKVGMEVSEDF